MQAYQKQYIENIREILSLSDFYLHADRDAEKWFAAFEKDSARAAALRAENERLLEEHLFPALDDLYNVSEEDISDLNEFADVLMDWQSNPDCGVYCLIHESLLTLARNRHDRDAVIRELYKLGMGIYYRNRYLTGVAARCANPFYYENEMLFTEAASYLKYFARIDSEETKGYIVRSMANIAICSVDHKRRIAATGKAISVCQDPYYRELAPGLPWDTFLRRAYQQMSSNRRTLSRGDLSVDELSAVMDACYAVFGPEKQSGDPNVRWLWPYYEMEYSCGLVDLATTMDRMEWLIESSPEDRYDISGLYSNVQLPIYYGRMLREHEQLASRPRYRQFLARAYKRMMKTLLSFPAEQIDSIFLYNVTLVLNDYYETEGAESYHSITARLMKRLSGSLYLKSRQTGAVLKALCLTILRADPDYFDDIPFLKAAKGEEKAALLAAYAEDCGLYLDIGILKMGQQRLTVTRRLFDREDQIYQLHVITGADDLRARSSTERFADVVLGHHAWYDGSGGYPESYTRSESPYRKMTDAAAVAAAICEEYDAYAAGTDAVLSAIAAQEGTRFSPLVTFFLEDPGLRKEIDTILKAGGRPYFEEIHLALIPFP